MVSINTYDFRELENTTLLDVVENRIVVEEHESIYYIIRGRKRGGIKEYYINAFNFSEIKDAKYHNATEDGDVPLDIQIESKKAESFLYLSDSPYYITESPINLDNPELLQAFIGKNLKFVNPILHEESGKMAPGLAEYVIIGVEEGDKFNIILTPNAKTHSLIVANDHMALYPDYSIKVEHCISNHYVMNFVNSLPDDLNDMTDEEIKEIRFINDQYLFPIFDEEELRKSHPEIYSKIYEDNSPIVLPGKYKPVYGETYEDCIIRSRF